MVSVNERGRFSRRCDRERGRAGGGGGGAVRDMVLT